MSKIAYHNKNYYMYSRNVNGKIEFIIHNKNKEFDNSHTHVSNYNLGKIIIYCCIKGDFPSRSKRLEKNYRVLESILRICDSNHYDIFKHKIENLQKKDTTLTE